MALTFDLTHKHVKAEISDFGHTHLATEVTGSFNDVTLTSGKNLFVNGGAIYLQNADSSSNGTIRTSVNPASGVLIHNYNAGKNLVLSAPQGQIVFTNDSEATYKKIWHQGNQGSGSGLDADKLDGVEYTTIASGISTANTTANAAKTALGGLQFREVGDYYYGGIEVFSKIQNTWIRIYGWDNYGGGGEGGGGN
jgi:hypothetical protein